MKSSACVCLPEAPIFRSKAERKVWKALRAKLRPEDILLHGVAFTGQEGDSEVDIIVLMPEGFATVEVKGGKVWFADGVWKQSTPHGIKNIDLEHQASEHRHRVARYLAAHWSSGQPRMQYLVAVPDVAVGPKDPSPGLLRSLLIDKSQLDDCAGIVYDSLNVRMENQPKRVPGPEMVQQAAQILAGRGDPQTELLRRASAVDEEMERLTRDQFLVLDAARNLRQVEISGGPGTGKTWLAVEQARRWTKEGRLVGFVSYSRGLGGWVQRTVKKWPEKQRNLMWSGSFHGLGRQWGVKIPDDLSTENSKFWDVDFLDEMAELAGKAEPKFDALIVDEAQDFDDRWWPILLKGLRNPEKGRLMVFADERQKIFDRAVVPIWGIPSLSLVRNMRNTKQIARVFRPLLSERSELIGIDGPPVRFLECATEDAMHTADDAAVALLDEGWQPKDVALLTTHHRHPVHRELTRGGKDEYWSQLWDNNDIFYGTVAGFKGLERQVVVLAVDGFRTDEVARQVLLVGLSRARQQLVVCGSAELLRSVGGKEFMKRLHQGGIRQ